MVGTLVGVEEMAEILGVAVSQVRRMEARGEIPSYRPGRYLRFDPEEVLAALRRDTPTEDEVNS